MAKSATQRPARPARDHDARLRRLVFVDVLKGWTITLIAVGVAIAVWPMSIAGVLDNGPAIGIATIAAMVAALHAGLCDFADERTTAVTVATLLAFIALWLFVVYSPFQAKLNPGREVFSTELPLHGQPVTVPLSGAAGDYRLIVEGHLGASAEHASRSAHYDIALTAEGQPDQTISGDFTERWSQRRSGRRGVSTVHVTHTEQEHEVSSAKGADLHIALDTLSPGAHDAVSVQIYRDTFPATLFLVLGAALTGAAMVVDSWRYTDPQELLMTTITLGALLGVVAFRRFAPPHPGFGDLAFNGAVGAIGGMIGGRILVRVVRAIRSRRA